MIISTITPRSGSYKITWNLIVMHYYYQVTLHMISHNFLCVHVARYRAFQSTFHFREWLYRPLWLRPRTSVKTPWHLSRVSLNAVRDIHKDNLTLKLQHSVRHIISKVTWAIFVLLLVIKRTTWSQLQLVTDWYMVMVVCRNGTSRFPSNH